MFGSQLLTSCKEFEHCSDDTFCDPLELVCRPCIQCVDLRRLPPSTPVNCITSAARCGPCFTGLVENKKSLSLECVEERAGGEWGERGAWGAWDEWLVTLAALHLLALLLCACAALVLRNFRAYKLRASTSVETGPASLPPPPPYNPTDAVVSSHQVENEETSAPLIKETASLRPEAAAAAAPEPARSRESARHVGARVFNEPVYQTLITSDENYPSLEMLQHDLEIPEFMRDRPVHLHNGASSEITLSEGQYSMDMSMVKASKSSANRKHRVRQDSDGMNDSEDSGYGEPHAGAAGAGRAGAAGGATFTSNNSIPFYINIFRNFTTIPMDAES